MDKFGPVDQDGSIRVPHSAIFYSPELQEVHIRQIVNLLEHRNPYTGSIYAEDPAIWDIEIINEQSVLFYTSSHGLEVAWGEHAINSFDLAKDENIAKGTVVPMGNPFFWNKKTLAADNQILITAIARARNSGQKFDNKRTRLLAKGDGPILMEPVRATHQLKKGGCKVSHGSGS